MHLIFSILSGCRKSPSTARVVEVIDGDTIIIEGGYHVRYIGIDSPEKHEPFYSEAKRINEDLVEGKVVKLQKDISDQDKHGRMLRYIYIDEIFVNAEIVRMGYANRFGAITANGQGEKVLGQIMMLKGANSGKVIRDVKDRVAEVQKTLPEGIVINPFLERTELITKTTMTITENLVLGALIVIFVVVLLLG